MKKIGVSFLAIFFILSTDIFSQTISGGNSSSAMVCGNRKIYSWGQNSTSSGGRIVNGILATGSNDNYSMKPEAVLGFPLNLEFKSVDVGGAHFLAISCAGDVWAWGNNEYGQVGNGLSGNVITTPVQVKAGELTGTLFDDGNGNLTGVVSVSAGNSNSFALLEDGTVVAWGGGSSNVNPNASGQLGNGSNLNSLTPVLVLAGDSRFGQEANAPLKHVIEISAGDAVTLAIVDEDQDGTGWVYSWGTGGTGNCLGRNNDGTSNPNNGDLISSNKAYPVVGQGDMPLGSIKQIAAGDVSCFALEKNGIVWAWGNDWSGSDGDGYIGNAVGGNIYTPWGGSMPRKVAAGETAGTSGANSTGEFLKAKFISAGQASGLAVTWDNKPVKWGRDGVSNSSDSPVYVRDENDNIADDINQVFRFENGGGYINSSNNYYVWGENSVGNLGIGNDLDQEKAVELPRVSQCDFVDPIPQANLNIQDTLICEGDSNTFELNIGFTTSPIYTPYYAVSWYKDGDLIFEGDLNDASTLIVTDVGIYKVVVEYLGANGICGGYPVAFSITSINYTSPPFEVDGEFCDESLTAHVLRNLDSKYEWYAEYDDNIVLANTVNGQSTNTISVNDIKIINGIAPERELTLYVEDVSYTKSELIRLIDLPELSVSNNLGNSETSELHFEVENSFDLHSIDMEFKSFSIQEFAKVGLYNSSDQKLTEVSSDVFGQIGNVVKKMNFGGLTLEKGSYYLKVITQNIVMYSNGNTALRTYSSSEKDLISINSLPSIDLMPAYFNWSTSNGTATSCKRYPVSLLENCITTNTINLSKEIVPLYPNPTSGIIYFPEIENYSVLNTLGIKLFSGTGNHIDLSDLSHGMYLIQMNNDVFKVMKK